MIQSIFHKAKSEGPLYALFLNCTLKKSPEVSNTEALCNLLIERLKAHEPDIETEIVRVVDFNVLPGIANDEGDGDEWPPILERIKRCNIFIPAMSIWTRTLTFSKKSQPCLILTRIERLAFGN